MAEQRFIKSESNLDRADDTPLIVDREPKIEVLSISDFAREIGLEPDDQGRFTFGPENVSLAYEYGERFSREKKAEGIVIDGAASPGVIAALLHGAHPAEGYLFAVRKKDEKGEMVKDKVKILEPLPNGEGQGPEGFTWTKKEASDYTLVEFALSGEFNVDDLKKVIPPEVDPSKPVIISGRGPLYLTHTIAAAYRHYKGLPAVLFYQPASKFGPAKTEVGISHSEDYPLGLNFGEPEDINQAKEKYKEKIEQYSEALSQNKIKGVEIVRDGILRFNLENGESYLVFIKHIEKENN